MFGITLDMVRITSSVCKFEDQDGPMCVESVNKDTCISLNSMERPEYYFTSDSWPGFIPFPICGISFHERYAHDRHNRVCFALSISRTSNVGNVGMQSDYSVEARGFVPDSLGNDRDIRIAGKRHSKNSSWILHVAHLATKLFEQSNWQKIWWRGYLIAIISNIYLAMIQKCDNPKVFIQRIPGKCLTTNFKIFSLSRNIIS